MSVNKETVQASALRQIEGFEPIIDETLEPGDIFISHQASHVSGYTRTRNRLLHWLPLS